MKKYLAAVTALVLLLSLAGCAGTAATESQPESSSKAEGYQEPADLPDSSSSFSAGAGNEEAEEFTQSKQTPAEAKTAETRPSPAETAPASEDTQASAEEQAAAPKTEPPQEEPAQPVVPEPTAPPAAESEQTPPPQEPEPEPPFDVSPYVQFAVSYGTSSEVGLLLDSTATSCWDDPLTANAKSLYLERDLKDRLDWYKASGCTRFWVWAEQTGDSEYQVYIGYA